MDKFTRKSSFEQWMSPIDFKKVSKQVTILNLDHYTKKLNTLSFVKLLLYSQLSRKLAEVSTQIFQKIFKSILQITRLLKASI
ncbi:DUF4372 domain-containing protein [Macrococcoides bohemicum]|nr:DUF4372 domain-containing protein [Macrococcus bohemicus]